MRHNAKKDDTHNEIRDALIADGWSVTETHKCGGGIPDMFATLYPVTVAVEAKSINGKLTEAEKEWRAGWDAPYIVAYSGAEAVAMARPFLDTAKIIRVLAELSQKGD